MKDPRITFLTSLLLIMAIVITGTIAYKRSDRTDVPIVFSEKALLEGIWNNYKKHYLEPGTQRTLDKQRDNITTSEGQSYTMLRAVWQDDHATFDTAWQWTKDNLQREDSYLFSWLFGKRADGSYGVLSEQNGQNTASDADIDIAVALIFAFSRWKDPAYLEQAKNIIDSIWKEEVVVIDRKPYLAANNVERLYPDDILVNPSYFAPYAYRMFATIDPAHDWMGLVDTAYEILEESSKSGLDAGNTVYLPPNWILVDKDTAVVRPPSESDLNTNYSYDALRTPWRIALDWKWYSEPRAEKYLRSLLFLDNQWRNNGAIYSEYSHDGTVLEKTESMAMYGGSLGALMAIDTNRAREVYERKLISRYNPDTKWWKGEVSYYDNNWAWFGIALYNDALPNLWESAMNGAERGTTTRIMIEPITMR